MEGREKAKEQRRIVGSERVKEKKRKKEQREEQHRQRNEIGVPR